MSARLDQTTFSTSRLLDFCSRKELIAQTGHQPDAWPLVVLKELVDNALDACEEAEVAPQITIQVNDAGITVIDNGPGIPVETITDVLDFSVRISSRENGATAEEIDFLLDKRVELNAFASDTFVEWIEGKLKEHGVSKVIPDEACLASAYSRAKERAFVQQKIDAALAEAGEIGKVEIPDTLRTEVEDRISEDTAATWDSIIRDIAEQKFFDDDAAGDE